MHSAGTASAASIALGAGADTVQFGLGNGQYVRGGDGADQLTMNNTAASIAVYNSTATAAAAKDDGTDTIFGAGTGDIILFNDYLGTAGRSSLLHSAITTGLFSADSNITTAAAPGTAQVLGTSFIGYAAGGTAVSTSMQFIAMYTAAGDMVIEVLLYTGSGGPTGAAFATGDVTTIVINGKGDMAKSSLLRIDTIGSSLMLTLL